MGFARDQCEEVVRNQGSRRRGGFPHRVHCCLRPTPLFGFPSGRYSTSVPPQRSSRPPKRPVRIENRIRAYRLKARLSQDDVAQSLGTTHQAVSAWEVGKSCPTAPLLFRLARILNTFVEALYPGLYEAARRPLPAA